MLLAAGILSTAFAAGQIVRVEVFGVPDGLDVVARTTWLGEERTTTLAGEDIRAGEWTGEVVRMLPVRIEVRDRGESTLVYDGLETIAGGEDRLAYAWEERSRTVRRVPAPPLFGALDRGAVSVAAGAGWALLALVYVQWLVRRRP